MDFLDLVEKRITDGNEKRTSILPTENVDKEPGFAIPGYDFQAAITPPAEIGVRRDNTMGSVIDAARGVAYYTDVIGFGQASNEFTRALPADKQPKPIGINYFIKTNVTCPNGEPMYRYIEGIPQGTAMGEYVKSALGDVGLPEMKGLAPGMIEDAKSALDPRDLFRAAFGDAYPDCVEATLPVGDIDGRIRNPKYKDSKGNSVNGSVYLSGPFVDEKGELFETQGIDNNGVPFKKLGDSVGTKPYQKRWIQRTTRMNTDETKIKAKNHPGGDPIYLTKEEYDNKGKKNILPERTTQSFADYGAEEAAALQRYSIIMGSVFIGLGLLRYFSKK